MKTQNEFVPYEQALELKELGFDEPCFTKFEDYFNKTKLHPILATLHLNTPYENEYNGYDQKIINNSSKRWFFTGHKNSVKDHNNDILSAPTFSQAFRWFREKYDLCAYVVTAPNYIKGESKYKTRFSYEIYGMNEKSSSTVFITIRDVVNLSTHEEAELECLKKLIEIAKEN